MPVGEMLERMSAEELTEWQAYARIEPFGEDRADLRAGMVASMVGNVNLKKGAKPFKPADFMPFIDKPDQGWQDQKQALQQFATRMRAASGDESVLPDWAKGRPKKEH